MAPFSTMYLMLITLMYVPLWIDWIVASNEKFVDHRQCHLWDPVLTDIVSRMNR